MIEFYGGYQVYSESGVDLTLLRENLKRSVADQWLGNFQTLPFLDALQESGTGGVRTSPTGRRPVVQLEAILRHLTANQVEYVVIGGLALIAHGSAYITKDVDICYSRTPKNLAALAVAFAAHHPYLRGAPAGLPFQFDAPTIQAGLNFTLVTDLGDVDLLGEVRGIGFYDQVYAQSVAKSVFGLAVRVLSIDGLIAAKKAAGRAKDKLHLLELEELKKLKETPPQE
jgi:predicted nucleotidyltransferase